MCRAAASKARRLAIGGSGLAISYTYHMKLKQATLRSDARPPYRHFFSLFGGRLGLKTHHNIADYRSVSSAMLDLRGFPPFKQQCRSVPAPPPPAVRSLGR